jgi:hypothetical protein
MAIAFVIVFIVPFPFGLVARSALNNAHLTEAAASWFVAFDSSGCAPRQTRHFDMAPFRISSELDELRSLHEKLMLATAGST